MKRQIFLCTLTALAAMLAGAVVVPGQEASLGRASKQQKDRKTAPRPPKVWTNDDFASSLPSADAGSKDKGTLSVVGAQGDKEIQTTPPPPNITAPKSLEEADKLIQRTAVFANDEAITLARKEKELEGAPESKKADLQREVEMHRRYMQDTRQELKAYQDKKKELEKKENQTQGQPQTQN